MSSENYTTDNCGGAHRSIASVPAGNPRYVPPPMRDTPQTMQFGGEIERPESAMSNASFVSQINPEGGEGGVSVNSLLNHAAAAAAAAGRGGGDAQVQSGQYAGQGAFANAGDYGQGAMMGNGRQDGYGQMGQGGYGQRGGFGGGPVGPAAYGGGPGQGQGRYSFGNLSLPANQAPTFLRQNSQGMPNFGAVGSGPSPGGYPMVPGSSISSNSAHDSIRGLDTLYPHELADFIRAGHADPGDDFNNDAAGRGRGHGKFQHQNAPMPPCMIQHRATPSMNAALDLNHKSNAIVVARTANTKGNAAAFLAIETRPLPDFYMNLQHGVKPTVEEFFFAMPVIEPCRFAVVSTAGVVRIRNIPYVTPRSEITAFVGRNAQIVGMPDGSPYFAVHIIMERHTGKTMDAFIEFSKASEAQYVVGQFAKRMSNGRHPRLGDRHVEVELSSQDDLMMELFPCAKNIKWEAGVPHVLANNEMYYEGVPAAGFTGFLHTEELVMTVKHAETPHRSPFAQRAIIRVYESHISTLHKYPWFAHDCVNMAERRLLFDCTLSLTRALISFLRRTHGQQVDQTKPTASTLQELTVAALTCPGFSEGQKSQIVHALCQGGFHVMTRSNGMNLRFGGNTYVSPHWPFQVLARDPSADDQLVNYFASLMREATTGDGENLTLAQKHALRASGGDSQGPFGNITFDYGCAKTLAEVGAVELATIESLLTRVLPRGD